MKKKITIISVITLIVLIGVYFAVGNYFYNFALNAEQEKEFLKDNPHLEAFLSNERDAEDIADDEFRTLRSPTAMSIVSNDEQKLKLHADVYQNGQASSKWVIAVHGYTSNAKDMIRSIRNFYEKGYSVLAPDLRGHGESEGDYIGMGWHDRLDVLLWIDRIIEKDPNAEIVLYGVSMGGATVMMTAGEELPSNVKVIVEDCGYSSVSGVFTYQLDDLFGLPEFPVLYTANTVTKIRAGYDLYEASAVKQVAKSKIPILFIHGDQDSFVPYEMVDEVYEAAKVEKEKLVIPEAGHGMAASVDPELYWSTVWDFVDRFVQ